MVFVESDGTALEKTPQPFCSIGRNVDTVHVQKEQTLGTLESDSRAAM